MDVCLGPDGVLTGSARVAQEAKERAATSLRTQEIDHKQRQLERKRKAMEARIATLREGFEAEEEELMLAISEAIERQDRHVDDREAMAASRRSVPVELGENSA